MIEVANMIMEQGEFVTPEGYTCMSITAIYGDGGFDVGQRVKHKTLGWGTVFTHQPKGRICSNGIRKRQGLWL